MQDQRFGGARRPLPGHGLHAHSQIRPLQPSHCDRQHVPFGWVIIQNDIPCLGQVAQHKRVSPAPARQPVDPRTAVQPIIAIAAIQPIIATTALDPVAAGITIKPVAKRRPAQTLNADIAVALGIPVLTAGLARSTVTPERSMV